MPIMTSRLWFLVIAFGMVHFSTEAQLPGPEPINQLPVSHPSHRIPYGSGPLQFGDLRLPVNSDQSPVAVVIHGGCWKSRHGKLIADLRSTAPLASALTNMGIATWNIEYRQIDNPGGGWPGTFEDIAKAVDHLPELAKSYPLDLNRVVIVGHSAGGHLGTWVAARHRLPAQSPFVSEASLAVSGVVNLAGPVDLEAFLPMQNQSCRESVIVKLLGGSPSEVPDRYRQASPSDLLPIGVRQVLINGAQDKVVPAWLGRKYAAEARSRGDNVEFIVVENASHFEVITPGSVAWPAVEEAVFSILKLTRDTPK